MTADASHQEAPTPTAARPPRAGRRTYRRLVVKAGTGLLTRGGDRLDLEVMATLVEQIARLRSQGVQVALVSSGAVAAGRHILGLTREATRQEGHVPFRQVLAAVGQGRLMHAYEQLFDWHDIPVAQALLTRRDINDRQGYLNVRNTLEALLGLRVVPIINENDVVSAEEITGEVFGDNDTLSALVANLVDADLLVLLGELEGLFTADPHVDPGNARLIPRLDRVTHETIESLGGPSYGGRGRGGMGSKLEAARMAAASGCDVVIASGLERDVLIRLVAGERVGTYLPATTSRLEGRRRWLLSRLSKEDQVVVDRGAVTALRRGKGSLLPAGVVAVRGDFLRGDVVTILGPDGEEVACGVTNYDARDLDRIKGLRSDRIVAVLGYHYGDEVVHRDNMAML